MMQPVEVSEVFDEPCIISVETPDGKVRKYPTYLGAIFAATEDGEGGHGVDFAHTATARNERLLLYMVVDVLCDAYGRDEVLGALLMSQADKETEE